MRKPRPRGAIALAARLRTVVLLGCLALPHLAFAADLFVSPSGSDANPGTPEKPLLTLEAARDRLRETLGRMRSGAVPPQPLHVRLMDGDFVRRRCLELDAQDSGTPGAPVTWSAAPGARPRLLGGQVIRGFRPVTDPALLSRWPAEARSKIVVADARLETASTASMLTSRGFGRAVSPAHPELFFNGRPMPLARWPNEGTFQSIAGFPEGTAQGDDHGGKLGQLTNGFTLSTNRPALWADITNVWVHGYWSWDWANSYERITSYDAETRWVRTAPPHGLYGFRKGQRIHFLNVLEELDAPGEWFLDAPRQQLYFWPPADAPDEILLSELSEPFVRMRDVSHLSLREWTLEATRASAIEIHGGASNRVEACLIRNIGNHGIVVTGGNGHGVQGCDLLDTGDGGVSLTGGDRATLRPGGHFVENCHFQRQGRWSKCYVPAIHLEGVGQRASHNLIHDHPHCAILYWGNDHRMEFNEIHHIALETGDVGAIYTGRDFTFRGNRIVHNFIHHTGGVGMGSMGVYMDDCVSGTEIRGNIFYKVHRAAFLGGGRDHDVVNNVFVDCDPAIELDGRGLDTSPVWRAMVDQTMRARLTEVPLALYRERYPEMKSLDASYGPPGGPAKTGAAFEGVPPSNNRVSRNIAVGKWLRTGWHAGAQHLEVSHNVVGEEPGFVGPITDGARARDFQLKPDSPAWKEGFARIPVEDIGLVQDANRGILERLRRR